MEKVLDQFNATIDTWIICLDDYNLPTLCRIPAPGSWSLGRMYIHIIEDSNWFVGQIKTTLLTSDNAGKDMNDIAKTIFKNNELPDRALANPNNIPDTRQPKSKVELLQGLFSIKADVNELCRANDLSSAKGKTLHPGFLYFTALEWLQFADMHMRHHFRQKKRIDALLSALPPTNY
jgi:DinB superfamily